MYITIHYNNEWQVARLLMKLRKQKILNMEDWLDIPNSILLKCIKIMK